LLQIIRGLAFVRLTIFAAVQHFKRKNMYIVPIAWLYVTFMMAVAEATSSQGTVLGACITFVLYGLMPIALILYFMGSPARRRQRLAREAQEAQDYLAAQAAQATQAADQESPPSQQANTGHLAPGKLVTPVRKES
jgi:hypothetical protein